MLRGWKRSPIDPSSEVTLVSTTTIVHVSDLHFGWPVDLDQVAALRQSIPALEPDAIAVSGDITQRARHGEFQRASVFLDSMRAIAPTLVVPGNHDVQWWQSPFGICGQRVKYTKYRQYIDEDLTPVVRIPGAVLAGALSAYGFSVGALTWNPNDVTVKGHLPEMETDRVGRIFAEADPSDARIVVLHHNVLRGQLSQRMGLAHWRSVQTRLVKTGADVVLCGHDHQEGVGQIDGVLPVSTVGTHTSRSRGKRPTVWNVIRIDAQAVSIQHMRWDAYAGKFHNSDTHSFARPAKRMEQAGVESSA
jgi:predicted MPP superfamily phosphohydrolase